LDVENWAINERAFVQVKADADQAVFDDYLARFRERTHYDRMIFAVHWPRKAITAPSDDKRVQLWEGDRWPSL
jgi:hypothetical protein